MAEQELRNLLQWLHVRFKDTQEKLLEESTLTSRIEYAMTFDWLARVMGGAIKEGHEPCVCQTPANSKCAACSGTGLKV